MGETIFPQPLTILNHGPRKRLFFCSSIIRTLNVFKTSLISNGPSTTHTHTHLHPQTASFWISFHGREEFATAAKYQKRPNLLFPELTANWQHLVFINTHISADAPMTEWQTWDESFEVAERIDVCLCAYETLLTLTSPRAWGHDTDLGILAINLPLILSPTVWVACVSGPMKVTPSAACRDNKGFTFTAQAYQVEAEHAHSRVNTRVWEKDSVGGQKKFCYICSFLPIFFRSAHRHVNKAGDICLKQSGGYRGRPPGPSSSENSSSEGNC